MVTNHRELGILMERINSSGQGEITFWEFLAAFKPPKPGAPKVAGTADMKKLRLLLATVEHETLKEAFERDHDEDGLSDAEEPAVDLYATRAEALVRSTQRAAGDTRAAEHWYDRMARGGSSVAAGTRARDGGPSKKELEATRAAARAKATEAALARESHLSLPTRIGLHRRRFLLTSIMQEKERHVGKVADLTLALHGAEARGDHEAATVLHETLTGVNARHAKRIERLAATALVINKERDAAADAVLGIGGSDDDDDGDDGGDGEGDDAGDDGDGSAAGGGSAAGSAAGGGDATGVDAGAAEGEPEEKPPTALAIEISLVEARMPRLSELVRNCQRFIAAAETAAAVASGSKAVEAEAGEDLDSDLI
jgi:hypothetical protein